MLPGYISEWCQNRNDVICHEKGDALAAPSVIFRRDDPTVFNPADQLSVGLTVKVHQI